MMWEQAIRTSSWLPPSTTGMSDRGLIAFGTAADIAMFALVLTIDGEPGIRGTVPARAVEIR
jgi:N-acyl-D-aspartate/D-glutamate deacylase